MNRFPPVSPRSFFSAVLLGLSGLVAGCGGGGGGGYGGTPAPQPPPPPPPAPATLVSIAITPAIAGAPYVVIKGLSAQFIVTGTYSDKSTATVTAATAWTSSATNVLSIGASTGAAMGLALGTTNLTATVAGVPAAVATVTVTAPEYAYVTNFADGTISAYTVGQGGSLVPNINGATVAGAAGSQPYALAVDSSHHYLYVVNYKSNTVSTVSEYNVGTDGTLTPMTVPTVPAGSGPDGITVNNNNVYVVNYGGGAAGSVWRYSIGAGGALTFVGSVPAGAGATAITFNAANSFAYVANFLDGSVSVYSVSQTGALTPASTTTLPTGSGPVDVLFDPTGQYAYVADLGSAVVGNTISQFSVTAATGALTALSTATVATGNNPRWLAVNPANNYVFVPNAGSNTVQTFTFGAGGVLSLAGSAKVADGTNPDFAVVDPSGQYLYLANRGGTGTGLTAPYSNGVSQFSIGAGGALAPLSVPTVATGTEPASIVVTTAY
ncbi:MAG: hypothetical protein NVSMB10_16670 [Steroidobacteraceae bacterium]